MLGGQCALMISMKVHMKYDLTFNSEQLMTPGSFAQVRVVWTGPSVITQRKKN